MPPDPYENMPEGAALRQKMLDGGAPSGQVAAWEQGLTKNMLEGGAPPDQVARYWGTAEPDMSPTRDHAKTALDGLTPEEGQKIADNPLEMLSAGLQMSVSSLMLKGKPDMIAPEDAGLMGKILHGAGMFVGDIPFTVAGFVGGAAAGAPLGGFGGLATGGAGAAALPESMRQVLIDHYNSKGGPFTWGDFWSRAANVLMETGKAAVTGAVTGPFGAAGKIAEPIVGKVAGATIGLGAQAAVATSVGAGLEGRVPNNDDFITGGVLALGMHAGGMVFGSTRRYVPDDGGKVVAENLKDTYVATGRTPIELGKMAAADPTIQSEIIAPTTATGERVTPVLDSMALTEPKTYREQKPGEQEEEPLSQDQTQILTKDEVTRLNAIQKRIDDPSLPPEALDALMKERRDILNSVQRREANDRVDRALTIQGDKGDWQPPMNPPPPEPPEGPPEGPPRIEGPPGGPEKPPFTLNEAMIDQRILDIVDKSQPGQPSFLRRMLSDIRRGIAEFQSQLTPANEVDNRFKLDQGQIGVEDMLRQTYASKERAGYFIRWGGLDPITLKPTGTPSWMEAFNAVKEDGGTMDGFMAYRLAKRTIEKAEQGITTGVSMEDALAKLAFKGVEEKYARGADILRRAKDASIDYATGSGMFTEAQATAMKELNREHIVMRRVMDPDYSPPRPGKTFAVRAPVKEMKGSERQIVDPATAEIDNLHTIIAMADRNRAIGHVVGLIEAKNAEARQLNLKEYLDLKRVDNELGFDPDTQKILKGELFDENGNPIPDRARAAVEGLLGFRNATKFLKGNDFLYFNQGKPEIWRVSDPNLAEVLRIAWQGDVNPVANFITKFAGIQRAGITGSPSFPFRAILHGQLATAVAAPHGSVVPFHDFAKGFWEVVNQGEKYKEWIANGGAGTALSDMDRDYLAKDIETVFRETKTENAIWNVVKHPIDTMRAMQHFVDAASRVGYMKRAENAGLGPLKAATESRTAYLDHAEPMKAAWVNTWARMTPFMPIGFKDIEQVGRAMRDRPVSFWLKGATILSMPTILNYVANKLADSGVWPWNNTNPDFTPYHEYPQWERDLYWITPPINGVRMKIKSPYVMGFFFKTLPERFMDYLWKKDPRAFREWGQSMIAQYVPPFVPALATPVLEQAMNKSFLTQRPLVKSSLEGVTNWMQYTPETSLTARKITQLLGPPNLNLTNMSPIVLENYAREWGGTLPTELLRLFESPLKPPTHPWEFADNPFIGSFFARNPGASAQTIQDFYGEVDKLKEAHASFRLAIDHGDMSEIQDTLGQRAVVSLSIISQQLRSTSVVIQAIAQDEKMTPDEKRQRTDQLAQAMILEAKAGLTITDALK